MLDEREGRDPFRAPTIFEVALGSHMEVPLPTSRPVDRPARPRCISDGLATDGLEDLAAREPIRWAAQLERGVPGRIRLGSATTLREVGRAAAWPTLLPSNHLFSPRRLVRHRRTFRRLARAVGEIPVMSIDKRVLSRVRKVLATNSNGVRREAGEVRRDMLQLRLVVFELQVRAKGESLITLDELAVPRKPRVMVYAALLEQVIGGCSSLQALAVLAVAVGTFEPSEAERAKLGDVPNEGCGMHINGLTSSNGRRIPGRRVHLPIWAMRFLRAWRDDCYARGHEPDDALFPSPNNARKSVSGLSRILGTACRRADAQEVAWKSFSRVYGHPRQRVVDEALRRMKS